MKVLQEINKNIDFLFFSNNIEKVYIYIFFGMVVKEKRLAPIF